MFGRQTGGRNTLLNYFNKLPSQNRDKKRENDKDNLNNEPKEKRLLDIEDDENIQPVKRRKRIIAESDSSDESDVPVDEVKSKYLTLKKSSKWGSQSSDDIPDDESDISLDGIKAKYQTPKQKSKLGSGGSEASPKSHKKSKFDFNKSGNTPAKSNTTPSKSQTPRQLKLVEAENTEESGFVGEGQSWTHTKLDFLKPEKIRDKNGKRPSDPDYDPRTLYVPQEFIAKQSPAHQQWWALKRDHYDCVLFFKVGKFYELFHMDAVVGVNELGFSYMKGDFAHSGFPESAYGRMVSSLVDLGYKVARVEQTETPDTMAKRLQNTLKGGIKHNKVVTREICQITNRGTRVQGLQDLQLKQPLSTYLLAISENRGNNSTEFGVCFVDTSIGIFYLGQFQDDNRYSRLLTMLAQFPPAVILEERKRLNNETKYILKTVASNATFESLNSETQFMSSAKTLKQLQEIEYFDNKNEDKIQLPDVLESMISEDDPLKTTCKIEYDLAIRCLGACLWYLKDCLLDIQLFSMGKFEHYIPPDMDTVKATSIRKFMILDSSAMSGLNILGEGPTLEKTLDQCCTAMGKRLLHQWICKPICNVEEIRERQDAISELIQKQSIMSEARVMLKSLPDLERLISRIHCLGNGMRARNHPDSRAVLYEEKTYSKRKVEDFIQTLNGFEKAINLGDLFSDMDAKMIKKYACFNEGGLFPDIMGTIVFFKNSFNAEEAEKEGKIIPQKGIDSEYDDTISEIQGIQEELNDYLKSQQKFFGCSVQYFGNDKKRFQLDVPDHASYKANKHYFLEGTKKGSNPSKRYTTNETRDLLARMLAAETKSEEVLHDINRRIFEKFSEKYEDWSLACYCLSALDVLCSLAQYTTNQNITMCVPEVLPFSSTPMMIIRDGVHPFVPNVENFVPNDTELGTDGHSNTLILTGPNMGGKSTLMRQVALLTIMAQLGCHVPGSNMKFTLVDKIFTRLGAHDDIISGSSTFLVELIEASAILKHSTKHSLVFLDELGRGTATYDGTAIATAYVDRLIKINCRTIFSTHYYSLLDFFKDNNSIQLSHMACKVEADGDDVNRETVIFMYKMIMGPCPKSYGFNAAKLAGISLSVTSRARLVSQKLEGETIARKLFRKLLCDGENVRELLSAI